MKLIGVVAVVVLLLLSLSLPSLSIPLSNTNVGSSGDSDLWTYLKDIVLGTTLTHAYHSPKSFALSVEFELDTNTNTDSNGEYRIGCSNYQQGSVISKMIIKDNDQQSMVPYIVNYQSNAMCFLVLQPKDKYLALLDQLDFIVTRPLKVHDSIYETIGVLMGTESRSTVQFRSATDITIYFNGDSSGIYDSIDSLDKYDLTHFDTFFWSSKDTPSLIADTKDKRRSNSWNKVVKKLQDSTVYDPCGFRLNIVNRSNGGVAKIPISTLWNMDDNELVASCLGHITSSISKLSSVRLISLTSKPQLLNFRSRSIGQTSTIGNSNINEPYTVDNHLLGKNQIVSVGDTGVDETSCYFYDKEKGLVPRSPLTDPITDSSYRKIIQYSYNPSGGDQSDEAGGHGTHTCGTIAGAIEGESIQSGQAVYDGVAPDAKLVFIDLGRPGGGISTPQLAADLYDPVYNAGSRTHSNSWGGSFIGSPYYCNNDVDHYLYDHVHFNIFFAAGNDGDSGDGSKTISMEATGKNIIAVGSSETTFDSENINYVAYYSSQGPAYDNRIKPDIINSGDAIESALSNGDDGPSCGTVEMSGTSMACPGAAGFAALIKEFFERQDLWYSVCKKRYKYCRSFKISGVLTKALLIHSGKKLELFHGGGDKDHALGEPPDNYQGWGRLDLSGILSLTNIYRFDLFVDDLVKISDGSTIIYNVQIPPSSMISLIATIAWYDPPNTDGTTQRALLQDLDLVAVSPSENKLYSNNGDGLDDVNNNERIVVVNPETGLWSIIVTTKSLPYGSQLFSISITSGGSVVGVNKKEKDENKYDLDDVLDDIYTDDIGIDDDSN